MCLPLLCFMYTAILTLFLFFFKFLWAISYREFSQMVYGALGRLRIPLPACVYQAIKTKFRENSNVFTGSDEDIDSE